MKTKLILGALIGALLVPLLAGLIQAQSVGASYGGKIARYQNGIEFRQLDPTLRFRRVEWPTMDTIHWGVTSTAARETNNEEIIMAATAASATRYVWTSTLGVMRFPARVGFTFFDSGANSTINCAYFDVTGSDQNGHVWSERVYGSLGTGTPVQEATVVTTSIAFAQVTRIETPAGGCGGGGASDQVIVFASSWVALPIPAYLGPVSSGVNTNADILSVCMWDPTDGSSDMACLPGRTFATRNYRGTTVINLLTGTSNFTVGGLGVSAFGENYSFSVTYRGASQIQ